MNTLQTWAQERADLVERLADSVVAVQTAKGRWLSGVVWDAQTVVTAAESLTGDRVVVRSAAQRHDAEVAALDLATDVAVLRVRSELAIPTRAEGAALRCGQPVVLVGRDAGEPLAQWTDIQLVGPAWRSRRGGQIARTIRFSLRLDDALEGGAIFDVAGSLCAMVVPNARGRAIGIPVETLAAVVGRVAQYGYLPQPYLGVRLQPVWLDEAQRKDLGRERETAVIVTGVDAGSPAQSAGLMFADLVLSLADRPVHSPGEVAREIGVTPIGSVLPIQVLRAGVKKDLSMTIGERPRG
ncbi:MAG TPA: S1C family serine protease [Burkholderiaceae bacterium]|nr:S1C family serine protease [Burkholderiaceae bacterium]